MMSGLEGSDAMLAASATVVGGVDVNDALFEDASVGRPEKWKLDSDGSAGSSTASGTRSDTGTDTDTETDTECSSAGAVATSARRPAMF